MPPREWRLRIEDMLDAIGAIEEFVAGMNFEAFRNDRKTVDAVVRNLEVIGEAARHVPEDVREEYDAVPWKDIIGIRSVLIHEYFGVDFGILWATIETDLPTLTPLLESMLEEGAQD